VSPDFDLFDTHCHLQDPKFGEDVAPVVARAAAAGVGEMLLCAYDLESVATTLRLAHEHPGLLAAVGIHPHDADQVDDDAIAQLRSAALDERCVAIGEIGLDHFRDLSPRDVQLDALNRQLDLAVELALPVSLHSRNAEAEILQPLRQFAARSALQSEGRPVGTMHCFAGSLELAREFVGLGFLISIPCTITYPNNDNARELATRLPMASLVVETDSPYLPPQSIRGRRNEPMYLVEAVQAIAHRRGVSVEEVAHATTANARRAFPLRVAVGARA
jgi:TatD DNase family protein